MASQNFDPEEIANAVASSEQEDMKKAIEKVAANVAREEAEVKKAIEKADNEEKKRITRMTEEQQIEEAIKISFAHYDNKCKKTKAPAYSAVEENNEVLISCQRLQRCLEHVFHNLDLNKILTKDIVIAKVIDLLKKGDIDKNTMMTLLKNVEEEKKKEKEQQDIDMALAASVALQNPKIGGMISSMLGPEPGYDVKDPELEAVLAESLRSFDDENQKRQEHDVKEGHEESDNDVSYQWVKTPGSWEEHYIKKMLLFNNSRPDDQPIPGALYPDDSWSSCDAVFGSIPAKYRDAFRYPNTGIFITVFMENRLYLSLVKGVRSPFAIIKLLTENEGFMGSTVWRAGDMVTMPILNQIVRALGVRVTIQHQDISESVIGDPDDTLLLGCIFTDANQDFIVDGFN